MNDAVAMLSSAERERCARFIFDDDRRDYAVGHALLRTMLSVHSGGASDRWSFATNAYGKPFLERGSGVSRPLQFSLSHTRGLVACAVTAGGHVGVDVTCVERKATAVPMSPEWFSRSELAQLERCEAAARPARFAEFWALKEAFVKAIGVGLSCPLYDVTFDLTDDGAIRFTPPAAYRGHSWQCALFAVGSRYRLALVVDGGPERDLTSQIVSHELGEFPTRQHLHARAKYRSSAARSLDRPRCKSTR